MPSNPTGLRQKFPVPGKIFPLPGNNIPRETSKYTTETSILRQNRQKFIKINPGKPFYRHFSRKL
jgi:hypothetical protein